MTDTPETRHGPAPVAPAAVLARIPESWGRELRCGPGWWPLLERLDAELAAVDPGYVLLQAKEKFGGLRYYTELADDHGLACCAAAEAELAVELGPQWAESPQAGRRLDEHAATEAHRRCEADRAARTAAVTELVRAAEAQAARTCEQCGQPGRLHRRGGWYSTVCDTCAGEGWQPATDG